MLQQYLAYENVALLPKYSILTSRSQADVSIQLGNQKFKLPIVPANMSCVIDTQLAKWMSENEYFYIMHRFADVFAFVQQASTENWKNISISVGVKQEEKDLIEKIVAYSLEEKKTLPHYITIDIAHGHSIMMKEMIAFIKKAYTEKGLICPFIIAGNVATRKAVEDLAEWGADAVKVGIAQGGACTTFGKTGFGAPMFTCMKECVGEKSPVPLIADGGIRNNGDVSKALATGARLVMAGTAFAACIDSPAEMIEEDGVKKKIYYGSASAKNKGNEKHIEGTEILVPCNNMTYEKKLQEFKEDIQSAVSYAGGDSLEALTQVEWIQR